MEVFPDYVSNSNFISAFYLLVMQKVTTFYNSLVKKDSLPLPNKFKRKAVGGKYFNTLTITGFITRVGDIVIFSIILHSHVSRKEVINMVQGVLINGNS